MLPLLLLLLLLLLLVVVVVTMVLEKWKDDERGCEETGFIITS